MMTPNTQTILASTVIALTIAVALVLIPMKPDGSVIVLGMMALFIVVWNGSKHLSKRKCGDWINSKARHEILFAIILASLLLLGSISATLAKELEIFEGDLVKRIVGVNIGLMLIVLGNYMPKKITAKNCAGCACAKSLVMQRFMGWTFVLAGLLYASIWIFVDLDHTSSAVLFSFPVAITIIIIARLAYIRVSGVKNIAEQSV